MKTAIKQILSGETNGEYIKLTEEYNKLSNDSLKIYEKFYGSLTEKQKKQFDDLFELECEMHAEMEDEYYKQGLTLGLRLGAEVFGSK